MVNRSIGAIVTPIVGTTMLREAVLCALSTVNFIRAAKFASIIHVKRVYSHVVGLYVWRLIEEH